MPAPLPSDPPPGATPAHGGMVLEYRTWPPGERPRVSRMAVTSLVCGLLACPGLPLLVRVSHWSWLNPSRSDAASVLLVWLLACGVVSGRFAWLETHAADQPLRGRAVAALGLTLNVLWLVAAAVGLVAIAWVERHGLR